MLDVVPNHMAVTPDNRWWWDVLENGPSSVYASYFDVDWDAPEARDGHSHNVVLLARLGDHYGRELEAGRFRSSTRGHLHLALLRPPVPIAPRSLDQLVSKAARRLPRSIEPGVRAELESIGTALGRLPPSWATDRASVQERHRDKEVLRARLAALCAEHPQVDDALDAETEAVAQTPTSSTPCCSGKTTGWRSGARRPKRASTGGFSTSMTWSGYGSKTTLSSPTVTGWSCAGCARA